MVIKNPLGYEMPRTARTIQDGGIYHVMTRGNNGQIVFHHDVDCQRYLEFLAGYMKIHQIAVHHFVLMPNHIHLLVRVTRSDALGKAMLGVNLRYSLYYSKTYSYTGHLWQGRYKTLPIDPRAQLLECARYIELHPVRGGLVLDPAEHPWSSYRFYAEGASNPFLTVNPAFSDLGHTLKDRQHQYREFIYAELQKNSAQPKRPGYGLLQSLADPIEETRQDLGFPSRRRKKLQPTTEE